MTGKLRGLPEDSALLADMHDDRCRKMVVGRLRNLIHSASGAHLPPTIGEQIDEGMVMIHAGEED